MATLRPIDTPVEVLQKSGGVVLRASRDINWT